MVSKAKRLFAGSSLGVVNFFAVTFVSLYMMPFLIKHLGDHMYGLWLLVGSTTGFYGFLDFGLNSAVQRYLSRALSTNDTEEANKVINSSLYIFFYIGLAALVLTVILSSLSHVFFANPIDAGLFQKIILMVGVGLACSFPMRVFWAIFATHLRYDLSIYIDLVKLAIRTTLIIVFLRQGYGLLTFALIMFTTDLGGFMANIIFGLRIGKFVEFKRKYIQKSQIKKLFQYSIFSFIGRASYSLKSSMDNIVISSFLGLNYVTLFSVGNRLAGYYQQFITNNLGIVTPLFSHYEGRSETELIKEKFYFMTKITTAATVLVGAVLIIFGRVFIERWIGPQYLHAYAIMLILISGSFFALLQMPANQVLFGISKHQFPAMLSLGNGIANIVLSIIFVQFWGVYGVAWGTTIPNIINNIIIPVYLCRVIQISLNEYIHLISWILAKAMVVVGVLYYLLQWSIQPNFVSILSGCTLFTFVYGISVFFWVLSSYERDLFLSVIWRKK